MAAENHIRALRKKHADLDMQIEQELARPAPDSLKMTRLKRQKLTIKDTLSDLGATTA